MTPDPAKASFMTRTAGLDAAAAAPVCHVVASWRVYLALAEGANANAERRCRREAHREQALHRLVRQAVRGFWEAAVTGCHGQQLLRSEQVGLVEGIPAGGDPQRVLPVPHHVAELSQGRFSEGASGRCRLHQGALSGEG